MVNLRNCKEYMENFLCIRTKDRKIVRFKQNPVQEKFYAEVKRQYEENLPIRIICLKARQEGISTETEAIMFQRTATRGNVKTFIVAHLESSTANLFKMNKLFLEKLPDIIRPMTSASNAQEILFENPDKNLERKALNPGLNSSIRCNTAGGAGIGRSDTLQNVHASEFAFWRGDPLETWTGIAQAVPAIPGTMVVIESTANGFNAFKDMWDAAVAGESDYVPLFFAWFDNPEYVRPATENFELTKEEREIKEKFSLSEEQICWRRWCIRNNCSGDERMFRQEYPSTPDEAFLTSGDSFFDNEVVMAMRQKSKTPIRVGEFEYDFDGSSITNIKFVDKPGGAIRIFKEPDKKRPYVLGGDTAGDGSDYFSGFVIDNISCEWCAVLHQQYGEQEYTRQMFCLGRYYSDALIGVEVNFSTYPTQRLQELHYPKLYVRKLPDNYMGKLKQAYGYRTDPRTRPLMLAQLKEMFENYPELFIDFDTLGEMMTFVKNEDGRPEALSGKHDDLVMGLAVTYAIREQQRSTLKPRGHFMEHWTDDMKEDYKNSNEKERAEMRRIYADFGREAQ